MATYKEGKTSGSEGTQSGIKFLDGTPYAMKVARTV